VRIIAKHRYHERTVDDGLPFFSVAVLLPTRFVLPQCSRSPHCEQYSGHALQPVRKRIWQVVIDAGVKTRWSGSEPRTLASERRLTSTNGIHLFLQPPDPASQHWQTREDSAGPCSSLASAQHSIDSNTASTWAFSCLLSTRAARDGNMRFCNVLLVEDRDWVHGFEDVERTSLGFRVRDTIVTQQVVFFV